MWTEIIVGRGQSPGNHNKPGNAQLVKVYLDRSKQAPLRIMVCIDRPAAVNTFLLIIPHLYRVTWMHVHLERAIGWADPFPRTTAFQVPSSAPLLRELVFHGLDQTNCRRTMPWFFDSCTLSNLTVLEIHGSNYVDNGDLVLLASFTNLKVLSLSNFQPGHSTESALKMLSSFRSLTHLSLKRALEYEGRHSQAPENLPNIRLPMLQSISLRSTALCCVRLVQHCDFPRASARLHLYLTEECNSAELVSILDPSLVSAPESSDSEGVEPITGLFLRGAKYFAFYRCNQGRDPRLWCDKESQLLVEKLRSEDRSWPLHPFRISHLLHRLGDITELYIDTLANASEDLCLGALLEHLPLLETLMLDHGKHQTIRDILSPLSKPTFLAALKSIHLLGAKGEFATRGYKATSEFLTELYEKLSQRVSADAQCRVDTLVLKACPCIREQDLCQLRTVIDVQWDGQELDRYFKLVLPA